MVQINFINYSSIFTNVIKVNIFKTKMNELHVN